MYDLDYKCGELIAESAPFVYALNSCERGARCDFCFKSSNRYQDLTLKRCSNCKISYFCDVSCQRSAWKAFHKAECSNLSIIPPENSPTETFLFFSRLAVKVFTNRGDEKSEDVCNISRSFNDLEDHVQEVKCDHKRQRQFVLLHRFLSGFFPSLLYDIEDLWSLFGKMVVNTYTICDSEEQAIGTGLYIGASIFNHSCEPNAVAVFKGTVLYIRAIKNISCSDHAGVFLSYIDPFDSIMERQVALNEQYYFNCSCPNCLNEKLDEQKIEVISPQKAEDFLIKSVRTYKDLNCNRSCMEKDEKEKALIQCKQLLEVQEQILGKGHTHRIRLLDLAFDLCIDLALWKEALEFALPTLEYYRQYYCKYYPSVGIQLFKIGKIHHYIGQFVEAEKMYVEAKDLLCVCLGSDHCVVEELESLLYECRAEMVSNTNNTTKLAIQE